jgi:hypothetical protein
MYGLTIIFCNMLGCYSSSEEIFVVSFHSIYKVYECYILSYDVSFFIYLSGELYG